MLRNYDDVFRGTFFVPNALYSKKFDAKPFFCISLALQLHCNMDAALHCNRIAKGDAKPMQNHLSLQCNCNATAMQWQCKTDANQQCNGNATALQK
jgi:hypothetical protein